MIKPHSRLRVETLVALIGVKATANICYFVGGHRVPRYDRYRAWEQRVRLVHDWLQGGYTQRSLAAKYGLAPAVVKKVIRTVELKRREARLARTARVGLWSSSVSLDAVAAEAGAGEENTSGPVALGRPRGLAQILDELRHHPWPGRASFLARLARLADLALILPPTEERLLDHLRARRPLRLLDGTPGFPSPARRNERLQRFLSRVRMYCGSAARHRLMQPYDRLGHEHRLRWRRRLLPRGRFRPLRLWVPGWFEG
jgi:hypothetical protein